MACTEPGRVSRPPEAADGCGCGVKSALWDYAITAHADERRPHAWNGKRLLDGRESDFVRLKDHAALPCFDLAELNKLIPLFLASFQHPVDLFFRDK